MDRNTRHLLGALGGLAIVVLGVWMVASSAFDRPAGSNGWVYDYQTLIAGVIATLAAAATIATTLRQTKQTQAQFLKQLKVSTDLLRREIDRESGNFKKPAERLLAALHAHIDGGIDSDLKRVDSAIGNLMVRKKSDRFDQLRRHLNANQAETTALFFAMVEAWDRKRNPTKRIRSLDGQMHTIRDTAVPPATPDRELCLRLAMMTERFISVLVAARLAADAWVEER